MGCDHRPFQCATECLQYHRYTCVAWRQTADCSADGRREQHLDRSCDDTINPTMSGFCECGDGRVIRRPGCARGEFAEPFSCRDECAHEPDLYEELGLDSGASEKAIKQAFRKLSLRYHPDKTRSDPALTARFTSIREAYDVVSDQEQRALYDAAGLKLVSDARHQKLEKGPAVQGEVEVTLEQLYNGEEAPRSVARKVICRGCAEHLTERCRRCTAQCANEVEVRNVQMGPMVVQQQVEVPSRQRCRVENVALAVAVERGMADGERLSFKGMGEQQPGKIPGDVVLVLRAAPHPSFRRAGADLHVALEVSLREALLGFERTLTHLDGRRITFTVDGVTKPSGVVRIGGEGMPQRGDPTQRGDLYIKLHFAMPKDGRQWLEQNCPSCLAPPGPS